MRLCICMSKTKNIEIYANLTEIINKHYARKHGYSFRMFNEVMTDRAPQWCKIKVINTLLSENKYDYLFWIDADAFFNKSEQPLRITSDKDIIICDDIVNSGKLNTINTGTFFVKCSDWSKTFFKELWNYNGPYLYRPFHEQTIMEHYIDSNREHFEIRPCIEFNTEINKQLKDETIYDNFVIHLMALSAEFRFNFINNYYRYK